MEREVRGLVNAKWFAFLQQLCKDRSYFPRDGAFAAQAGVFREKTVLAWFESAFRYPTLMGMIAEGPFVHGCFDESGKWKNADGVFVFAGIVIFQNPLGELTNRWHERLTAAGMPYTSMKEAMHFDGPYAIFKDQPTKRDDVVRDWARLIADTPSLRVATPMDRATIDAFKTLTRREKKKFNDDPYYMGFESCIIGALQARTDTLLHIVCDLAEQYSGKCIKAFHAMRNKHPEIKTGCVGIAFADDERHVGLQAADLIAYCARAEVLAGTTGRELRPVVQDILDIFNAQDNNLHTVVYKIDGGGLGEAELQD